jgi:hypothetical protein
MKRLHFIKTFIFLLCLTSILTFCKSHRFILDEKRARAIVESAFTDSTEHNVINRKEVLLKNKKQAIKFAEKILFDIYGRKEIISQRPYEVYNIDGYWLIKGTLRMGWKGGTFLIIIDSHNYRVVGITHGR